LLIALLDDPYFRLSAPKSTGRELFSLPWLEQKISLISDSLSPQDVQATLAEFTALTISNEVEKFAVGEKPELLVCGGGCKNDLLMQKITQLLPNWRVCTTDQRGISSDYMEAIAFAWLAYRRVHALPNNLPEVTGASRLASLGVIYPSESQEYSK
jgi:anhydro-N-acetylmuramic acid kinase